MKALLSVINGVYILYGFAYEAGTNPSHYRQLT
jgi:hypothetical protein